jgi:hypothetical protein
LEVNLTNKRKILDAKADAKGNITHVKLDGNSNFTSVEVAIPMADRGEIENTHVVRASDKKTHLRTDPDGKRNNNLDDMAGDT